MKLGKANVQPKAACLMRRELAINKVNKRMFQTFPSAKYQENFEVDLIRSNFARHLRTSSEIFTRKATLNIWSLTGL